MTALRRSALCVAGLVLLAYGIVEAQSTTGVIQGLVRDEQQAVVPGATVTARHIETNLTRVVVTGDLGQYRVPNLPTGTYEVTVELPGFGRFVQDGITLALNQTAVINVTMQAAGVAEEVTITADSPVLNTTNAEVGVLFDTKRVAELPLGTNRNIMSVALSAPGVSQLGSGQSVFASGGVNFSSNGMRVRSNNFMIDGQDSNDPSVTGMQGAINNPDIVQEIRLITNQFAAEFGRAAGSVMSIVTKSGTNQFTGSASWFHNDENFNARNNLDKRAGRDSAPFKRTNQYGGTVGGPVLRDKTFFFGAYQRWTDPGVASGFTLRGAPTAEGRQVLQSAAGHLPQVQALLDHLPAGTGSAGTATFTLGGQTHAVPLGELTGSADVTFENYQGVSRVDQQFNSSHRLSGRYMITDTSSGGAGQVTPPGLTTSNENRTQSLNIPLTSVLGNNLVNEARFSFQRLSTVTSAGDPRSEEIPSIEISELGMTGFNAAANRTAIGLAVNLPQFRHGNTYQFQNNLSYLRGSHAIKTGVDVRWLRVESFFNPTIRGLLRYPTLQAFVNDVAEATNINMQLPGGQEIQFYDWNDTYLFLQDEWRVRSDLTLNLGVRYELPGDSIKPLYPVNDNIVGVFGGDSRYRLEPRPGRDTNNIQPRLGFNWNPRTESGGAVGLLTGGDKMVVRGGYSRTHDYAFININLNIASSFPFVAALNRPNMSNAFQDLQDPSVIAGRDPMLFNRTIVADDFRSPYADQYSLEMQRELARNLVMRVGYVGTRGKDLFQTVDGNPMLPNPLPDGGFARSTVREDPSRAVIRLRANTARSTYDSLQTGLEKRLSGGLSAAVHYTWSRYLDLASEIFNPSSGEVAVAQDSFNREGDWGRSAYDRPHRFTTNIVYELPWMRDQAGVLGKIVGGWQISGFLTFQSGAPFTVLNGADPTGALAGIDGLVGSAIRPNLNTDLDLSKMTVEQILAAGGRDLFRPLAANERVGNVGRNTLRADGIGNLDLGFVKNHRFGRQNFQFRVEMFNATNTRNFGIPEGRVNAANFLNQWGTNGGSRQIWLAGRWTF